MSLITISSAGSLVSSIDSGELTSYTASNLFAVNVSSGGITNATTVKSGAIINVSASGVANDTQINGDTASANIHTGGVANGTIINEYGWVDVSSGGTVSNTTVNGGGYLRLMPSATAIDTILNGGSAKVSNGGIMSNATVTSEGFLECEVGSAILTNINITNGGSLRNCATNMRSDGGHVDAYKSGYVIGTASGFENPYGTIQGATGAYFTDFVLYSSGWMRVGKANGSNAVSADNLRAYNGGQVIIYSNGVVTDQLNIQSGGSVLLSKGGFIGGNVNIDSGAFVKLRSAAMIDFTLNKYTGGVLLGLGKLDADGVVSYDATRITYYQETTPVYFNDTRLNYSITVDGSNKPGTYKLIAGLASFTNTITVYANSASIGTVAVGTNLKVGDFTYALALNAEEKLLSLTISGGGVKETPSLVVTTNADVVDAYDGVISLREAILYAEAGTKAADDTYTITSNLAAGTTIQLTAANGPLAVTAGKFTETAPLTIDGTGLTLDASNTSSVFSIGDNNTVTIKNITASGKRFSTLSALAADPAAATISLQNILASGMSLYGGAEISANFTQNASEGTRALNITSATARLIVGNSLITGGTVVLNKNFDPILNDATADYAFGGNYVNGNANVTNGYSSITTIGTCTVSKVIAAGSVISGNAVVSQIGNGGINLLAVGTVSYAAGGHYLQSTSATATVTGNLNSTISGGTTISKNFYAGIISTSKAVSEHASVAGNTSVWIDASSSTITVGGAVIAGGSGKCKVSGTSEIEITGLGANLKVNALSGDSQAGIWGGTTVETGRYVAGDRKLSFTGFTGDLSAKTVLFDTVKVDEASYVNFTQAQKFDDISNWDIASNAAGNAMTFAEGTTLDFTGDTIKLTTSLSSWIVMDGADADTNLFASLADAASVVINGAAATWNAVSGQWVAGTAALAVDTTNNNLVATIA